MIPRLELTAATRAEEGALQHVYWVEPGILPNTRYWDISLTKQEDTVPLLPTEFY